MILINSLLDYSKESADVLIFTGNSYIKQDGALVMGRGAAKEVKTLFPEVQYKLGKKIPHLGKYLYLEIPVNSKNIGILQVKYHFKDTANLNLVKESIQAFSNQLDPNKIYKMNFPAIGNGKMYKYKNLILSYLNRLPDNVFVYSEL